MYLIYIRFLTPKSTDTYNYQTPETAQGDSVYTSVIIPTKKSTKR